MSINQLHGKTYEDHIKSAFQGSADHSRSTASMWDIEASYDKIGHMPTSIKTTKSNIVCMADARRFWEVNEGYRLLVCQWRQKSNCIKYFYKMYEFLITKEEHSQMIENVSLVEIADFHAKIQSYGVGQHKEARLFAKIHKAELQGRTCVILNPKIDSKDQRRLQCSLNVTTLMKLTKDFTTYDEENPFYRDLDITLKIRSSEREFSKTSLPQIDTFSVIAPTECTRIAT